MQQKTIRERNVHKLIAVPCFALSLASASAAMAASRVVDINQTVATVNLGTVASVCEFLSRGSSFAGNTVVSVIILLRFET